MLKYFNRLTCVQYALYTVFQVIRHMRCGHGEWFGKIFHTNLFVIFMCFLDPQTCAMFLVFTVVCAFVMTYHFKYSILRVNCRIRAYF